MQEGQQGEQKAGAPEGKRRYSVAAGGQAHLSRAQAIRTITFGRHVWMYDDEGKRQVFAFYKSDERGGRVYWCNPGQRDEDFQKSMDLRSLTDIYVGKQTPALMGAAAADAPADCCFSMVSRTVTFNFQEDSNASVVAWMEAIQGLLTSSGKKVYVETPDGKSGPAQPQEPGQRRYSVAVRCSACMSLTASSGWSKEDSRGRNGSAQGSVCWSSCCPL